MPEEPEKVSAVLFFVIWLVLAGVSVRTSPDPMAPVGEVLKITTDNFEKRLRLGELVDEGADSDQAISLKTQRVFLMGALVQRGDGVFIVDQVSGHSSDFRPGARFPTTGRTENSVLGNSLTVTMDHPLRQVDMVGKVHFPTGWARVDEPTRITGHLEMPCEWAVATGPNTFANKSGSVESEKVSFIVLPHSMQELMRQARSTNHFQVLFGVIIYVVVPFPFLFALTRV